ncbi:G-protein coupled receptor dmsr-1-like [Lineus longissimus]|uniref:G-protein coupled receptor dmsr-1-like n=1 Tax=Lineus longissimus TaxID=88925 RepID=UPI002B4FAA73
MANLTFEPSSMTYDPMQMWPNATDQPLLSIDTKTQQPTEKPGPYYWAAADLERFQQWYEHGHGYCASIICVLGIIANGLNIIVLTRKNMISATNTILSALAVADGLTMLAYFPFAILYYCLNDRNSWGVNQFLLFYVCFSVLAHSISIWLTVTLAIFRYLFIRYPRHGQTLCSIERAKLSIILVFFATLLVCIPNFMGHNVKTMRDENNETMYIMSGRQDSYFYEIIGRVNFWMISVLVKLFPCFLLIVLSILLIRCMQEAELRRKNLRKQARPNSKDGDTSRDRKTNRTTRMLLTVVILFVICELPQGIVGLLVGILGNQFNIEIYYPLGEVFDIIALLNNGINFILYCTMSKQFRDTFVILFFKPLRLGGSTRGRFSLVPNHSSSITKTTDL